jgi:hypothetical protein
MRKPLIHEEAFRSYLDNTVSTLEQVRDCISRCRRVEEYEGNIREHFTHDRGSSLLERLTYTKDDADRGIDPVHSISFKGSKGYTSIYEGTVSLKQAVMHYLDFLKQQR